MFDDVPTIDLNVARSSAADELAAQQAMGIHWGPYQNTLRRKCAIIDAMTPDERTEFADGIDARRIDEIAETAGVERADVVALLNGYVILADAVAEEMLCFHTHELMIAGKCPWCSEELYSSSLPAIAEVHVGRPSRFN